MPSADRAISGQAVISEWIRDIALNFAIPQTINALTINNPSLATIVNSALAVTTGTAASPISTTATSNDNISYRAGNEIRAEFTAQFSAQTASSTCYVGPCDGVNGFRFGWNGTAWALEHWRGGSLFESVPMSAWDYFPNGSSSSKFTLNSKPVALDPTKPNLYRFRWEHLGVAPFMLEILSPDGDWVLLHTFHFPNSGPLPSTLNPNLPIQWLAARTAGTQNISVSSGSAWAGTTGSSAGQRPSQVPNRNYVIATTGASAITTGTSIRTVTTGYRFFVTGITMSAVNTINAVGSVVLKDGSLGAAIIPILVPPLQGSGAAGTQTLSQNFSEPVQLSTGAYLAMTGAGVSAMVTLIGYEEVIS